jgi:hypothetical protein
MFIYQRLHLLLPVNPVTLSAEEPSGPAFPFHSVVTLANHGDGLEPPKVYDYLKR